MLIARCIKTWKDTVAWQVDPHSNEGNLITLLARLDRENLGFLDFHVFKNIDAKKRFRLSLKNRWLMSGTRLENLAQLCDVVSRFERNT